MNSTEYKYAYYHKTGYGYVMGDGTRCGFKASTEAEAKGKAMVLAEQKGVPCIFMEPYREKLKRERQEKETPPTPPKIEIDPNFAAVPTIGGIIVPLPLSGDNKDRFPEEVVLSVSRAAVIKKRGWVVVELDGRGVAVTPAEAVALGLEEAEAWIPDLSCAPCVPKPGELKRLLSTSSPETITSIRDARLLGIPEKIMAALPSTVDIPGADEIRPLILQRNECPDEEVEAIDRQIVKICLSIPLPSAHEWLAMDRRDYAGRTIQEHLRGVLHFAGLTGGAAAEIIGIDARTFRRYIQPDDQQGHKPMPYPAWFTLLTHVRK
ncbi:hypothetical protein [Desulfobotulus sp.]|uniref:hypothetical protein n=1 Tax=Desulfobotulus sp. TaxID=1940337 RepID=UPI002A36295B|nr:hypothetical protein [Desulfobotulus sp.]MDY0164303.1 hypothetical protein [Desulfobotulus sp.]